MWTVILCCTVLPDDDGILLFLLVTVSVNSSYIVWPAADTGTIHYIPSTNAWQLFCELPQPEDVEAEPLGVWVPPAAARHLPVDSQIMMCFPDRQPPLQPNAGNGAGGAAAGGDDDSDWEEGYQSEEEEPPTPRRCMGYVMDVDGASGITIWTPLENAHDRFPGVYPLLPPSVDVPSEECWDP